MKRLSSMTLFVIVMTLTNATQQNVLADGNVLANLEQGPFGLSASLVIQGDTMDNHIRVTLDAAAHVVIEGIDGTTVNGLSSVELTSGEVPIESVSIDLGNGNDTLEYLSMGNSVLSTQIITGLGSDSVSVGVFWGESDINIETGQGDDSVSLYLGWNGISYGGSFQISTGFGRDSVTIEANNSHGKPYQFGPAPNYIDTDQGDDTVTFKGSYESLSYTNVQLGPGDDLLIGDPDIFSSDVIAWGDKGHDTALNALYFPGWALNSFETIEN